MLFKITFSSGVSVTHETKVKVLAKKSIAAFGRKMLGTLQVQSTMPAVMYRDGSCMLRALCREMDLRKKKRKTLCENIEAISDDT